MRKALLLGFIALYGCASAPSYQPSTVVIPPAFRETVDSVPSVSAEASPATAVVVPGNENPVVETAFWQALGDTTLDRLVRELSRENLDVQAAQARVRGARAARSRAALDLTPSATFNGGYARRRVSSASFPNTSGAFPDQDIWDAGFDASWELDVFGRLRHTLEAQGALTQAARENVRDVQVSLTAELARTYFELRGAQEQLSVARQNAENQQHTLDITQQRLDAGRGTAFDAERAKALLSSTLASIPVRESQVAVAQYRIGVLVGRPPAQVAGELAAPGTLPSLPSTLSMSNPDALIQNRPDVARAERQAASQRALVGAAKAEYLPRFSIGGSAGYTSGDIGSLGNSSTFRYAVGPVISWPALNLGRVKAAVNTSQAREEEARAQYGQTVLNALEEVESSVARYRTSWERVARLEEASAAGERAAELARLRFDDGVGDFLQVLDAERTQLESQDQLAQGRTDAAVAYAALFKAVGGRW